MGVQHFENIFRERLGESIAKVVHIAQLFPRFVELEDNRKLMLEVDEK